MNRLTVVETVYHQCEGKQPSSIESLFYRPLESDEQALQRPIVVGKEWTALETWWITKVGMLVIQNKEGTLWTANPTPEELRDAQDRSIEISLRGDGVCDIVIPYKESARFMPCDIRSVRVRCVAGNAQATAFIVPR